MPQRLTVAGDATARSSGSNIIVIWSDRDMISPDVKQSFLLSSSTVFMFSIQIASTGPSKSTHWRSGFVFLMQRRTRDAKMPSCHSCVFASNMP